MTTYPTTQQHAQIMVNHWTKALECEQAWLRDAGTQLEQLHYQCNINAISARLAKANSELEKCN